MTVELGWTGRVGIVAGVALLAGLGGCAFSSVGGETLDTHYRNAAHRVDYEAANLPKPPIGLTWYREDDVYVLANSVTGLIIRSVPVPAS